MNTRTSAGHLFVLHGKIELVVHDVAIVPSDNRFEIEPIWREVTGPTPPCPSGWAERGWGRISTAEGTVYAVQVATNTAADDYSAIVGRVAEVLRDVHANWEQRARGQRLPIVAMPVFGTGRGGYAHHMGAAIKGLALGLQNELRSLPVDVALVTPDRSVYAATQWASRDREFGLSKAKSDSADELGARAQRGELALLLGAGVSTASGLPLWGELIARLATQAKTTVAQELSVTDQAEAIQKAAPRAFQQRVRDEISSVHRPGILHLLLVGLNCKQIVTTNYDLLYETAAQAAGTQMCVLPWSVPGGDQPWILKLHGDVDHHESIVLTRRHMVRYDAQNRPSAALLESLLLTKHLLVVGSTMTDDNVIRMLHEVEAYREAFQRAHGRKNRIGTVLDTDNQHARGKLWKSSLNWIGLAHDAGDFRMLEIFLDRVALQATDNSAWLLDARFSDLLDDATDSTGHVGLANDVRRLRQRLSTDEVWQPLREALDRLGADK